MTRVAILPVPAEAGHVSYRAVAGDKHSQGKTAGEALDALAAQLPEDEVSTLIVVQSLRPDRFFSAAKQQRLKALMERWRAARDKGEGLTAAEQAELEAVVEAEVRAATARAGALADELGR
ncbi:MAG: hypothetical protein FJ279_10465 [Planctomycetes bacterium]|nr:hypothetical protein [Planctomycetota bacterium]